MLRLEKPILAEGPVWAKFLVTSKYAILPDTQHYVCLIRGETPRIWCGQAGRMCFCQCSRRGSSGLSHGCKLYKCCDLVTSATGCCERCATVRLCASHGWASMQRARSLPSFQWQTPLRSVSQKALGVHVDDLHIFPQSNHFCRLTHAGSSSSSRLQISVDSYRSTVSQVGCLSALRQCVCD